MPDRHQKSSSKNICRPSGLIKICRKQVTTIFLKFTFAVQNLQPYTFQTVETNFIVWILMENLVETSNLNYNKSSKLLISSFDRLCKTHNSYVALAGFLESSTKF